MGHVPDLADELIRAGVELFVVSGASDAAKVREVTRSVPIVAWGAGDFVEAGLAANVSRPGGNVTGVQTLQPELASKHLSLLKEVIPPPLPIGSPLAGI
jgi:putative ABC transport system substrate-binding protein